MLPLVTVVVTTHNRKSALAELLECLSCQTVHDFEVVIVNDAGEDIKEVVDLYPELTVDVVTLRENQGLVYAKNVGVSKARGTFIMLLDDDDLLLPHHVEQMVNAIADADLVYSDAEVFDYTWKNHRRVPTERRLFAFRQSIELLKKFNTYIASGSLYRRNVHEKIGWFDAAVHHYWDWDFILRVTSCLRVKRVAAASVMYAFSFSGEHMSSQKMDMRPYLDRLCQKHHLGDLPTANFRSMLELPDLEDEREDSVRLWDGEPLQSRYASTLQLLDS